MAYAADRLRERRKMKDPADQGSAEGKTESAKPSDRSIQLSDQELKEFSGTYQPGEQAECLVRGRIDESGKLDVMEVHPSGGAGGGMEPPMRMNPMMMPG